jgi:hypothetical protein
VIRDVKIKPQDATSGFCAGAMLAPNRRRLRQAAFGWRRGRSIGALAKA